MVNIALVGYGNMGKFHARVLKKIDALACIIEPNETNYTNALSLNVPVFKSLDECSNDEIDAFVIAVPTKFHRSVTKNHREPTVWEDKNFQRLPKRCSTQRKTKFTLWDFRGYWCT